MHELCRVIRIQLGMFCKGPAGVHAIYDVRDRVRKLIYVIIQVYNANMYSLFIKVTCVSKETYRRV